MIKKVVAVCCLLSVCAGYAAAEWGLGAKGGVMSYDKKQLQGEMDYNLSLNNTYSGELTSTPLYGGFEAFYETKGTDKLGVSVGFIALGKTSLDQTYTGSAYKNFENNAISVPVTIYWKRMVADNLAIRLGGGADWMRAKAHVSDNTGVDLELTQSKVVPHVDAGAEWFLSKNISLGVNLGFLFGAKFDSLKGSMNGQDYQLYSVSKPVGNLIGLATSQPAGTENYAIDYNGLRGDIALRVYFGGE